jgi:hypothetical protein
MFLLKITRNGERGDFEQELSTEVCVFLELAYRCLQGR